MTDWNSYDTCDVVSMAAAGTCWLTPGSTDDRFTKPLVEAVNDRRLDLKRLQENVYYLLRIVAAIKRRLNTPSSARL